MKLNTLLERMKYDIEQGDTSREIGRLIYDSRKLKEGDLFVCMTKSHADLLSPYLPAEKICVLGDGIPDPYGGTREDYEKCAADIHAALEDWIRKEAEKQA